LPKAAKEKRPKVKPFLLVRIKRTESEADLLGLCAGYEAAAWRADGLARTLIRNLPQFALPIEQWNDFNTATGVEQLPDQACWTMPDLPAMQLPSTSRLRHGFR
jgi:hypothetical protein